MEFTATAKRTEVESTCCARTPDVRTCTYVGTSTCSTACKNVYGACSFGNACRDDGSTASLLLATGAVGYVSVRERERSRK